MQSLPEPFTSTIANCFGEAGVRWLEALPQIIAACERRWSLHAGEPFQNLSYNYVAPAIRKDGTAAILKIGVPNPELDTEIAALQAYNGRGCVQLLELDQELGALLLERLEPGLPLHHLSNDLEATRIAARVMRRLWRPPPPDHAFPTAAKWAAGLVRLRTRYAGGTGPLPADLVEKAQALFDELLETAAEPMLLHGDLHHENILSATRESWLVIDPKGLVGEPAYETGALLRNIWTNGLAQQPAARIIAQRVEILSEELGLDRDRLLGWGLAQAVLSAWWCIEDRVACWEKAIWHARIIDEIIQG